jgi:sugar phosphate isomerase/epimerase
MNAVDEQCKSAGLQYAYHNLNIEFTECSGVIPYDWLLQNTDPQSAQLEIDCYWLTRAGKDPKDRKPGYAPSNTPDLGPGPFTEVGYGRINWKRILPAASGGDLKHYYVEQDFFDRPVFQSIKMSYDYLKNLTL